MSDYTPPVPPSGEPPKPTPTGGRSRAGWWWLIVGSIVAITAWLAFGRDDDSEPAASVDSATSEVVYHVRGTAYSVDITIETPTGTSQQSGVDVPLKAKSGGLGLRFTISPGSFVYISAQNRGEFGTVTCEIEVDGVSISENTSQGAYSIATCEGRA